jgi:arginine repressor
MTSVEIQRALAEKGVAVRATSTIRRWLKRAGLARSEEA